MFGNGTEGQHWIQARAKRGSTRANETVRGKLVETKDMSAFTKGFYDPLSDDEDMNRDKDEDEESDEDF